LDADMPTIAASARRPMAVLDEEDGRHRQHCSWNERHQDNPGQLP